MRKPKSFMNANNKLIARAYITGRYGMLMCASNLNTGFGGKICRACGVIDDENHRINYCTLWAATNLCNSDEKIDFESIYSNEGIEPLKVIERMLKVG